MHTPCSTTTTTQHMCVVLCFFCFEKPSALCGLDQSAVIDVSLIIRSTPCINNHCRQIGEGATIAPSRLLYPNELIVSFSYIDLFL